MSIWTTSQPLVNIALRSRFHWARLATSGAAFLEEGDTPSMRALRQPYPSTAPDPSIFEDDPLPMDAPGIYEASAPQTSLSQRLQQRRATEYGLPIVRLIESGRFDQAYSLRNEYVKTHSDVRPHASYWTATMHSLGIWAEAADDGGPDAAEKVLEKVLVWLELTPGAHTPTNAAQAAGQVQDAAVDIDVGPALTVLLSVPRRVSAIARFSLALASRGYGPRIAPFVIPHIMRHSETVFSWSFLQDFDNAHSASFRLNSPSSAHPAIRQSHSLSSTWHGLAIRTLCLAGRVEAAVEALEHAASISIRIGRFTFTLLVQELERLEARSLLDRVHTIRPAEYSASATHPRAAQSPFSFTASTPSRIRMRTISELAGDLRLLRRQLFSISDPPSATLVADFMLSCSEHGRLTPIYSLRRLVRRHVLSRHSSTARSHSLSAYALYATSEMIYHTDRADPTSVLLVFGRTFQPLGIPEDILSKAVAGWEAERYRIRGQRMKTKQRNAGLSPIPVFRLTAKAKSKADEGPKLWPSSHALAVAWQALVQSVLKRHHGWKELETLYTALLAEVPHSSTSSTSSTSSPSMTYSTPPSTRPDAAYFNPFIIALGYRRGPDRALQIIQDMRQRDIPVTLHNWTALAGCYSRNKDRENALRILERLERDGADELDLTQVQDSIKPSALSNPERHHMRHRTRSRTGPIAHAKLPAPNLVTYATSLRGFVRAGMWTEAREMKEMMMREGYARGTNVRMDRILDDLDNRRDG